MNSDKVYIIAEAGVNHNGSMDLAFQLIDSAKEAGANAIKFQIFTAANLVCRNLRTVNYQSENTGGLKSQYEMLKGLELSFEQIIELKSFAENLKIDFVASPFDLESLQFLINIDIKFIKIASGEIINSPLLWNAGKTGKDLVISTGMATSDEVETCLATINHSRIFESPPAKLSEIWKKWDPKCLSDQIKNDISLLHCTSQYPTPIEHANLTALTTLKNKFGLNVGYSDHTDGIKISIAAVACGARVIEKHLTLNRELKGPDHIASCEPEEFKRMVNEIRNIEVALGDGQIICSSPERDTLKKVRQRIVATDRIEKNEVFTKNNLGTLRSESGVSALYYWDFIGKKASQSFDEGDFIINE